MESYKNPLLLSFKWTVSKGRNTYGYNICSLYVGGSKVATTNGGGYDMEGTVLAQYLGETYQDRLMTIAEKAWYTDTQTDDMQWTKETNEEGLYGMYLYKPSGRNAYVRIEGACGRSSVENIAKAAGIILTPTKVGARSYGYFLTLEK